jgi:hypothetical protein
MATSGTINKCYGVFTIAGTLGSNQNCTMALRKNNTTDTTVSSAIQLTATDVNFSGTSLGISVTAGDIIAFKFTSPTWTTNPTTVRVSATFSVE